MTGAETCEIDGRGGGGRAVEEEGTGAETCGGMESGRDGRVVEELTEGADGTLRSSGDSLSRKRHSRCRISC